MSVALLIEKIDGKEVKEYIPIATQQIFEDEWLPLCKENNLQWIPMFETGYPFITEDIPYLLEELFFLIKSIHNTKKDLHLKERVIMLTEKLTELQKHRVSIYIG